MLFNMLILGSLIDERGYVFHRSENNLFIVETTLPNDKDQVRIVLAFFISWIKHHLQNCVLAAKIATSTNTFLTQHLFFFHFL